MDTSPNIKNISAVLGIILIIGAGFLFFKMKSTPVEVEEGTDTQNGSQEMVVVVTETPAVNGTLRAPAGFPAEIPLEVGVILESATTEYPNQDASQLSVSYRSDKTVAQKYAEYKSYLTNAGYQITEGSTNAPVRALFGTKVEANLSVAISANGGKTLVQLSYLIK
ncbi:MAG: hypothetical protein Q7R67_00480 [bacterium]|nr:hypothetical protein [bacterium]